MKQNIKLGIGNRGHWLSISQGVGNGSFAGSHCEVSLKNGTGEFVNTCYWAGGMVDDVISYVNIDELAGLILKATEWVGEVQ
tara:strand:- start:1564 stop:1809 length:246 start_codon:yes stop_codon:yes gene_type:complete